MKVKLLRVGPIGTNCYILEDDQTNLAAVIDPGDEPELIQEALEKEGVEVRYLLLTHGHYDHTTAVPALHRVYPQADIYIHQADANGAGSTLFPLAGEVDDLKLYDEGDVIRLGDHEIQVLHTPGHSPGSVTLKVEDVLFTGDTLFAGSCGRTDLRGGSYEQIMQSLKRLGELKGDFHVCPGHEATSTLERERRSNPFLMEAMRS
ncbi:MULTISPECIES: MBL fold metallo-hydrolase [Eubacteriales]|jgi:glyoxylase-like metal-dependent hydrolase (beta-lactamase superfamily II)|uniref:MBL fold metallo-hydrolase n=1 Tax=Eubacteriales TaxID=186802 RepID=UPI00067EC639|nr:MULTISPECIES: MBL fold metallo-hydrolase [Eubacteriales]MBP8858498.1 MBL fold metallo-hydrolase [Lawsonibacter sp.]MBS5504732.1 MBL fold metallo-hydrolase [Oscillospiraceae bacterium]MCB5925191.1 MBL fold metallo-hydrolase [bacterium 210820-DFI.5.26]MEE0111910.1 MBL fold metallo-hydrolase [Eubacteriales bacterium]MCQ5158127.1 MBL fold metallo-hydrolase [Clostridium sp. DFI.5.61]